MKRLIVFAGVMVAYCAVSAQVSFSVDTNYVEASYPANAPVFYPWIEVTNNTGVLLEMRCVKVLDVKPAGWETWLEDLDSLYRGGIPDTTTFYIPAINEQAQYIIVSFFPDDISGRSTVQLKLYPVNDPTDSVLLTFQGNARKVVDDTTAISETNSWLTDVVVYPQPAEQVLYVSASGMHQVADVVAVNILGQHILLPWHQLTADKITVGLSLLEAGIYFLVLSDQQGRRVAKRFVKQ